MTAVLLAGPLLAGPLLTGTLLTGTVLAGLMAGLYVGFSCAVIPGLRRLDDAVYLDAMRAINAAIQNAAFGVCFVGALLVPGVAAGLLVRAGSPAAVWAVAGTAAYAVGLVSTVAINLPLNQRLEQSRADPAATARAAFERPWNRAHRFRTVASVVALALLGLALLMN